ncbi:hypothetical protein Droror1_Dr00008473 [Drosera rotundifolia]
MAKENKKINGMTMATEYMEICGVKIWKNASESMINELKVFNGWLLWESPPCPRFVVIFQGKEKIYLAKGKLKIFFEDGGEFFEIEAGDVVEFPNKLTIECEVLEAAKKYYNFERE